jgi:DNA-binding MarR family transcriptional regulator
MGRADPAELARDVVSHCIAQRVRRLSRKVTRLYDGALRDHDLTIAQLTLLAALIASGPVSPAELARAVDLDPSTMSRNLRLLVDRGLIVRAVPAPRGLEIHVIAAGRRAFAFEFDHQCL